MKRLTAEIAELKVQVMHAENEGYDAAKVEIERLTAAGILAGAVIEAARTVWGHLFAGEDVPKYDRRTLGDALEHFDTPVSATPKQDKPGSDDESGQEEKLGCNYQGHEFGAHNYPDSVCIEGYLWDADSGEGTDDGWMYDSGGDMPCPKCNREKYDEYHADDPAECGHKEEGQ